MTQQASLIQEKYLIERVLIMNNSILILIGLFVGATISFICFWLLRQKKMESLQTSNNFKDHQQLQDKLDQSQKTITDLEGSKREQQAQLKAEQEKLEELKIQFEKQKQDWKEAEKQLRNQLDQSQKTITDLEGSKREQQAQLKSEQEKLEELKIQFEKQKEELKNEFKVLSEDIFKDRQKILNEQNKENVDSLLKPLKEEIQVFRKRVNEVHTNTVEGNTSLKEEIKKVMEMGIKMRDEASRLTSALKGDSQKRGAWGEAQLERTLQMSGLVKGEHYEPQSSFKDEMGKQKKTDYIIKLPDNKHIVIDSKVSLISYEKAVSAETEPERNLAMDEYIKSVKRHIDDLASKDYANLNGINSPSFVLMFMPIEPAYIEALKHDKSLFGYGYDKNIILLSHTTLIPILRTVANLWIMDKSSKEAGQISEKAGDIYNSVCSVFQRFEKLGHTLNTASGHYNDVVTALAGKQGLQGKVERFKQVSKKATKEMLQIEPKYLQFETSKLEIHQD